MGDKIAIIGYSGHAYAVLDACFQADIRVSYYCEREEVLYNPFQLQYIGNEALDSFDLGQVNAFVLGIGDNAIRSKVALEITEKNKPILNVIHPRATISSYVSLGMGNFVSANAIINAFVEIGNNCIINTGAIVEHECTIGDASHIAPGAVLAGNVTIGSQTFIGANSVIKQGVTIGDNVTIGAGGVVIKDIPSGETWVGNPAKRIK